MSASLRAAVLLLGVACGCSGPATPAQSAFVLAGVTLIDATDAPPRRDVDILVRDGRIANIARGAVRERDPTITVFDARGQFVIPGLWDMHVHMPAGGESMLPLYIANGVTGVRDMGSDFTLIRELRRGIASSELVGPRIVAAGPILDGPLGSPRGRAHARWRIEVNDSAVARKLVDSLAELGVDFIKVHERLSRDAYAAIAEAAKRWRRPFAGHVPNALTPAEASGAGQRSMEHLVNISSICSPEEAESLRPRTGIERLMGRCGEVDPAPLFARFVRNGTWHDPTLVVQRSIALATRGRSTADPNVRYVPRAIQELIREIGPAPSPDIPAEAAERLRRIFALRVALVGAMHRAGVRLLTGTDAPGVVPGFALHDELALLVDAGLTPMQTIHAATRGAAEYLGVLDSMGTVEPGKVADFVVLDGDPLADIRNTRRIAAVVSRGRVYDRAAIRALLAEAERAAR